MAQHQVLFCPFCRESFEGQNTCPEHELALVPLTRLEASATPDPEHDDDPDGPPPELRALGLFDPRQGRGGVALGALCQLAAFPLPLARMDKPVATYELAHAIPSLWTLSLIAFTVFYALARRRTPHGMRSLRVVVPAMGAVALACLLWAFGRLNFQAPPAAGAYLILAGALMLGAFGTRLGATRS
jgi:fumarate reductase subunit D